MDHRIESIAIHQPNYIPWLGYFFKIFMADHFVFHDDVDFSASSFTKRCLIRKEFNSQETQWLGVAVLKSEDKKIKSIKIDHMSLKIKRHLKKMEYLYHATPYYDYYFPTLKTVLSEYDKFESLAEFNIHIIKNLVKLLKINSNFYKSSDLGFDLKAHNYNLALIKHFDCSVYYSGTGAKEYQDDLLFRENNIDLIYLDTLGYLDKNKYPQHQGDFLPSLSIIDAIMNVGVEGVREIFFAMRKEFNPSQAI